MKKKKKVSSSDKRTIGRILKYAARYKGSLALAMVFAVLYVIATLTAPVLIGYAIDNIIDKGAVDFAAVGQLLLMTGVTVLACAVFQWLMGLFVNAVSYLTVQDIRNDIFTKFNTVPLKTIDAQPHGDLISRMINDTDNIGTGLLQGITQLFSGIVMILCTLGFMLMLNVIIACCPCLWRRLLPACHSDNSGNNPKHRAK